MYIMHSNYVMYSSGNDVVPAPYNVKARGRHGTSSLDLTIPAELKREYGISKGDVFIVEVEKEAEELSITYERVHQAEP